VVLFLILNTDFRVNIYNLIVQLMINSSFNYDVNFSKGNIDIKELNVFMNEKSKKIEKEQSKYDVDRDTHAKALNM
jgi:hypothetical protein